MNPDKEPSLTPTLTPEALPAMPTPTVQNFPSGLWSFHKSQMQAYGLSCFQAGEAAERAKGEAEIARLRSTLDDWLYANGPNGWIEELRKKVEGATRADAGEPDLSMSMFANRADYDAALAAAPQPSPVLLQGALTEEQIEALARSAGMYFAKDDFGDVPEVETSLAQLHAFARALKGQP